jgi:hypothetical protein
MARPCILSHRLMPGQPSPVATAHYLYSTDSRTKGCGSACVSFTPVRGRSAVVALSTSAQRRRAHEALARHLTGEPERRAWHLAQAAAGPDERVAGLLEQTAHRIRHRGDAVGAVTALLRAADLTPPGADRSRRLAEAAYLGSVVTGGLRDVPRLLDGPA